jgi:hypothetical protein
VPHRVSKRIREKGSTEAGGLWSNSGYERVCTLSDQLSCSRYAAYCEVFIELLRNRAVASAAVASPAESLTRTHKGGSVASSASAAIDANLLHLRLNAFHSVQALSRFSHFPG